MSNEMVTIFMVVPLLLVAEALIMAYGWSQLSHGGYLRATERVSTVLQAKPFGIGAMALLWLALVAVAWWYEFFVGLAVLYLVLFSLGRIATLLGAALLAAIALATPLACGFLLRKITRRERPRALVG